MNSFLKFLLTSVVSASVVFSASAANSISISSVNVTDSAVTVNYNTSGLSENDQVTVITYKAENASVIPDENNIKYINQLDNSTNTSLNFTFNETPAGTYQVKMGGTDIDTPDSIAITIVENSEGTVNYHNNKIDFFSATPTGFEIINPNTDKAYILKPTSNYFATFASVPSLEGYTVKSCGIIYNGDSYSAKIDLQNDSKFGILFKGAPVIDGLKVTAYPYVTYEKAGSPDITYYGSTTINTLSFE